MKIQIGTLLPCFTPGPYFCHYGTVFKVQDFFGLEILWVRYQDGTTDIIRNRETYLDEEVVNALKERFLGW